MIFKRKYSKHTKKMYNRIKNKTRKMYNRIKNKTRKMGGGMCAGCNSDNNTKIGGYYLNRPLPSGGTASTAMAGGGGQLCRQSPLQFLQRGGKKTRKSKNCKCKGKCNCKGKGKGMTGGGFWDFAKPFWNPSNPGAVGYNDGNKVLAPSCNGITPSGSLGPPVSTAGNKPMPEHQPWPSKYLQMPHSYQKGGSNKHMKRMKHIKGRRGMKGGSVLTDIQNMGRSLVYGAGNLYNGLMGVSNKIYAANPNPSIGQFPRGLVVGKSANTAPLPLEKIYKNADNVISKI